MLRCILALSLAGLVLSSCAGGGSCPFSGAESRSDLALSVSRRVALEAADRMVPSGMTVRSGDGELALLGQVVKVGDRASDFSCMGVDGERVGLSNFSGKVRVLSVFPSIDTRVCSLQTRTFNERVASLPGEEVVVISISADLPFAMRRYCGAEGIEATKMRMASDHLSLDFGLKYGMVLDGKRLLTRAVVVVDQSDVVRHVEYVGSLSAEPNYDEAFRCVEELVGR